MARLRIPGTGWMRRLAPRSLMARSLLIIGTPLIAVQLISTWVFYDRHVDELTRRLATTLASDISTIVAFLDTYGEPDDRIWITRQARSMGIALDLDFDATLPRSAQDRIGWFESQLPAVLREVVRQPLVVDTVSAPDLISVQVETKEALATFTTQRKRVFSVTIILFLSWSLGSAAVLLLIAFLFMRNQVRPIRRLAEAAERFGKGRDAPGFRPSGAAEVRQAAANFIIMRERIKRQMSQRTEMLAGISHDLRAPLTRMKLALAMIDDGPAVEELRNDLADMQGMVDEFLAFARGESAEDPIETDLRLLVREVAEGARERGVAVDFQPRGTLRLPIRRNAIKRCLQNIVGNAAQYGGGVTLKVQRQRHYAEITVDDTGPGIPEDKREEVFKPFIRLDSARSPNIAGVGLGLTIARDIVRGHGGDITLHDAPKGGLRVFIRLPL